VRTFINAVSLTEGKSIPCPHCEQEHAKNFDDCVFAAKVEASGADVAWSNDPDHMEHQITFTPHQLRMWLADNR
jgi:hypothetical protein